MEVKACCGDTCLMQPWHCRSVIPARQSAFRTIIADAVACGVEMLLDTLCVNDNTRARYLILRRFWTAECRLGSDIRSIQEQRVGTRNEPEKSYKDKG